MATHAEAPCIDHRERRALARVARARADQDERAAVGGDPGGGAVVCHGRHREAAGDPPLAQQASVARLLDQARALPAALRDELTVAIGCGERPRVDADGGQTVGGGGGGDQRERDARRNDGRKGARAHVSCTRSTRKGSGVALKWAGDDRFCRDRRRRWRSGRALGQPGADARGRAARRARERPRRADLARALGQLLPCHSELERSSSPAMPTIGTIPTASCSATRSWRYLERYAAAVDAPVREGVEVTRSGRDPAGASAWKPLAGAIVARTVVLSTGAYQRPHRPAGAATLPTGPAPDRRRGLPLLGGAPAGPGAGGWQRPVGLPDRRGAARGRT